jgi:hypothetical protein
MLLPRSGAMDSHRAAGAGQAGRRAAVQHQVYRRVCGVLYQLLVRKGVSQ